MDVTSLRTTASTATSTWRVDAEETGVVHNTLEKAIAQQLLHKTIGKKAAMGAQDDRYSMHQLMKTLQQEKEEGASRQTSLQEKRNDADRVTSNDPSSSSTATATATDATTSVQDKAHANSSSTSDSASSSSASSSASSTNKGGAAGQNHKDSTTITTNRNSNGNSSGSGATTATAKAVSRMEVDEALVRKLYASLTIRRGANGHVDASNGDEVEREAHHDELKIALFDFGGQWVFSVILHLFIRRNGCYVLCFNMEWLQESHPDFDQCLNYLRYWLNAISIHTWSEKERDTAKIFLCGTHKDVVSHPASHDRISQLLHDTFHKDNSFWPNVVKNQSGKGVHGTTTHCFYPVDNQLGIHDGILQHLMRDVQEVMLASPYTNRNVPLSWHRFVDAVTESVKQGNAKISLDIAKQMALACGVLQEEVYIRICVLWRKCVYVAYTHIHIYIHIHIHSHIHTYTRRCLFCCISYTRWAISCG